MVAMSSDAHQATGTPTSRLCSQVRCEKGGPTQHGLEYYGPIRLRQQQGKCSGRLSAACRMPHAWTAALRTLQQHAFHRTTPTADMHRLRAQQGVPLSTPSSDIPTWQGTDAESVPTRKVREVPSGAWVQKKGRGSACKVTRRTQSFTTGWVALWAAHLCPQHPITHQMPCIGHCDSCNVGDCGGRASTTSPSSARYTPGVLSPHT